METKLLLLKHFKRLLQFLDDETDVAITNAIDFLGIDAQEFLSALPKNTANIMADDKQQKSSALTSFFNHRQRG
jgi:hypothetical protein